MAHDTPDAWSDLDENLLSRIVSLCAVDDYASCRAVCTSWHAALPPPLSQPLAVLPADGTHPVSLAVCFLHTRHWGRLPRTGPRQTSARSINAADCRCVGARDGWVALVSANGNAETGGRAALFNPYTGYEISLDASLYEPAHKPAPKIVFSPNPTRTDFTAVSLCRPARLAVQQAHAGGGSFTSVVDTSAFLDGSVLADVAYGGNGAVYCLSTLGHVYVLCPIERRRRGCGSRSMSVIEVCPLLRVHIDASDAFPPPYDAISRLTDAKNLVLSSDGVLYQVWRRPAGAGSAAVDHALSGPLRGGGGKLPGRVYEGDVFVLRYDPTSWPGWTVVEDLGGEAFFIGMNEATVVRGGNDGVRPNNVYYWDSLGEGEYEPVVHNVATGCSVRWPAATEGIWSPVWYFMPVTVKGHGQRRSMEATNYGEELTDDGEEEDDCADDVPDRFRSKQTMNMLRRLVVHQRIGF